MIAGAAGVNVFFVSGAPKSGTTWLQRVLDAHPEVMCSGEGHFVDRFIMPLAAVLREYNQQMVLLAGRVYEGRAYYGQVQQADYDDICRNFIMSRLTVRGPGPQVKWVGDKTPRYALRLKNLYELFPQGRFINIVRDPRDVMMSLQGHRTRVERGPAPPPNMLDSETLIRHGVDDWIANVTPVGAFAAAHPGQMHNLRYEDMINDPLGEARRAFAFLGVSTDPAVLEKVVSATSFEAQSGRKPGEESAESFLRKGIAGDWVGRLDPWAQQLVEERCGDLMRQYGYL